MRATKPILSTILAGASSVAHGGALFPAGTDGKAAAMESSLQSRDAAALLYNPANLLSGRRVGETVPYAELGVARVVYSYEHPQFDPVVIDARSPTATLGLSHVVSDGLALGAVVFPTQRQDLAIAGVPRAMGDVVVPLDVKTKEEAYDLGLGAAFAPAKALLLGVSLVHHRESTSLRAAASLGARAELTDVDAKSAATRPVFGSRLSLGTHGAIGLSAKPSLVKRYTGSKSSLATGDADAADAMGGYEPAALGFGAEGKLGRVRAGLELSRLAWSAGAAELRGADSTRDTDADLHDVTQIGATLGVQLAPPISLTAGYAHLPSPWGEGSATGEQGVAFGKLDGVDRRAYALAAQWQLGSAQELDVAAYRSTGEREVSRTGSAAGFYRLEIVTMTAGYKIPL